MELTLIIIAVLYFIYKYTVSEKDNNQLLKNIEEYEKKEAGKQKSKV